MIERIEDKTVNYYYYYYYYYCIIVSFMQGSHTHIPETNHVPRGYMLQLFCLCCLWCLYV